MTPDEDIDNEITSPPDSKPMIEVVDGKICWRDSDGNMHEQLNAVNREENDDNPYRAMDAETKKLHKSGSAGLICKGILVLIAFVSFLTFAIIKRNVIFITFTIVFGLLLIIYIPIMAGNLKKYYQLDDAEEESWKCSDEENVKELEKLNKKDLK